MRYTPTPVDISMHMHVTCMYVCHCVQKLKGACGLDIVLHFTATTEHVLERASHQGRPMAMSSGKPHLCAL